MYYLGLDIGSSSVKAASSGFSFPWWNWSIEQSLFFSFNFRLSWCWVKSGSFGVPGLVSTVVELIQLLRSQKQPGKQLFIKSWEAQCFNIEMFKQYWRILLLGRSLSKKDPAFGQYHNKQSNLREPIKNVLAEFVR